MPFTANGLRIHCPATVVMMPLESTLRITLAPVSAIYRLLALSTATQRGPFRTAPPVTTPLASLRVAGILSVALLMLPPPATVVMFPLESTLRTRLLERSAMYTAPLESTAVQFGLFSVAVTAELLSPVLPEVPLPAMVLITPSDPILR